MSDARRKNPAQASELTQKPVGASLLAMVCQATSLCLILHREQARSYRVMCYQFESWPSAYPTPATQVLRELRN
ncbi:hypothetical protein EKG40_15305 [Pseudomonas moorei]|nr:hypothetical protein EKG40_15305 [Pseudomonas moorei]